MSKTFDTPEKVVKRESTGVYRYVPARYLFIMLSFFGFVLAYAYKVVLSVAIVSMVGHTDTDSQTKSTDTCFVSTGNATQTPGATTPAPGEFSDWDSDTQAVILGAFFYGYVVTQLPAGVLAERYGGKWLFGGAIVTAAVLSLMGPVAARLGYTAFIATRIGQGLAEGAMFPCMNAMLSRWMPKMERSRGTTMIYTGAPMGTVITLPLAGVLCDSNFLGGWPSVFYVLGVAGCLWFVLWALLIHETPEAHPYISQEEYDYIVADQPRDRSQTKRMTPWREILTSVPVYALIITHFGQNWGFLTILTLLPTYFEKVLNLNIKSNGLMSSLPYLLQAVIAWTASFISDNLRQRGTIRINVIRKTNNTIGMGLNGCNYPGFNSTHVDMAPNYAGTLMGLTNSIGNIPGFVAPMVAAAFYDDG
ncbi:unnamed protein product, partial [Medioppia subpectinata]